MFGSNVAWGIDVGETALRAVKLKAGKSGATVLAFDCVARASRADGYSYVDKEEQVREAFKTLVGRNKIGSAKVAISVPGAGFDRFIALPAVSMKQVPQIVKYEARQQIPFPLEEVAWDYQLACDRHVPGEGIEVALFAIKSQIIQQMLAGVSAAGLGVDIIGMSRLALYNVLKYDRQISSGSMIVDIGAGSTDIVILADGNFRVRSIPISGESVTKMLQQKFGISYEEAEELKKKASQSKQPDKMFGVMRPTFEKLLGEIHKTIGYYKQQQFKTLKIDQAFLVGESFKMQPLVDLFKESLGCSVEVLSTLQRVSLAPQAAQSPLAANLPSFAVAIGLGLQAAGQGPVTINVLPDESKMQRELSRKKPFAVAAAACLGIALAAGFYGASNDRKVLAGAPKPEALIEESKALKTQYDEARDTDAVKQEIAGIEGFGNYREIMLQTINEFSSCFGTTEKPGISRDIFIDEVTVEVKEPKQQAAADEEGEQAQGEKPKEPTTIEMTIKGWSAKLKSTAIYDQVVARYLGSVDIFTGGRPLGPKEKLSEFITYSSEESKQEAGEVKVKFTATVKITPPSSEAKAEDNQEENL
ncbi:MAG TPA: type IV pilus assembly protein PilM [Planctomycetota bacterium]|nr:type IV pilus assembly protein PilM [Planctomycetota bacterium]